MRPATYLIGFLAAASAAFAVPDISGLPRQIQECMIGNHDLDWTWIGSYHWENFSDEEFCKIDNVYPRTETKAWWVGGVFPCEWATWMDEKCGGHNIGVKHGTGKMCKRQP
ncbi:unnamed protein product [Aureobasidium pullulans]|nr:unnamed protein product [Aureobasidium pullulans]